MGDLTHAKWVFVGRKAAMFVLGLQQPPSADKHRNASRRTEISKVCRIGGSWTVREQNVPGARPKTRAHKF